MNPATADYDLYGLPLRVRAADASLRAGMEAILAPLASAPADGAFDLAIDGGRVDPRVDGDFRLVWRGLLTDGPMLSYYARPKARVIILDDIARVDLDLGRSAASVAVAPGREEMAVHCLYMPLLCEVLSHASQHAVHAAALALDDDSGGAVLLAGRSRRGKTTSALAMAKAGAELLSDDTCVAIGDGDAINVWGLRRPCRVRENTFRLLPFLQDLPRLASPTPGTILVDVAALWPPRKRLVRPGAIVLLDEPNPDAHRISPVEKVVACRELIGQNVHAVEPEADGPAGSAMRALTRLVAQCGTWRLSAGPDVESLWASLSGVMKVRP